MTSVNVALITPSVRLLGARRSLLALAKALDPQRYRPVVVCPRLGDLEEECRKAGIPTHIQWLPPWRKGKYWIRIPFVVRNVRRWLKGAGIGLAHCNEIYPTPYAVRAAGRLGIPVVSHMRLSVTERLMRNYHLAKADRVVVVSEEAAKPFRIWRDYNERVRVVHNGLDIREWRERAGDIAAARVEVRESLGLPGDAFLVGHIGLISRRKQQHVVLEAVRRVSIDRPWHVLIVGDPSPNEQEYGREISETVRSGLAGRVSIWPFRKEIAPVFAALDVNLLISADEGFGRVAIEAGALGVPTIGTRIGGIPEVVADGESGLLIDAGNAEQLAQAIERLAADEDERRRLGAGARTRVERDFSIEEHAARIMSIYDELLRRDPPAAAGNS